MPVRNRAELLDALGRGELESVLGTKEDEWVDFKKEPYRLEDDKGRWELAKDVASFANARGGLVVIGYKTSQSATELEEKASACEPVSKSRVDRTSYVNHLARWVYPDVIGLRLAWFPEPGEAGILVIEVPPQSQRDQPFIVSRMLGPTGNPTSLLGIPRREGAETRWMRPERLHALLSSTVTAGDSGSENRTAATLERAAKRAAAVRDAIEAGGYPAYLLQAVPPTDSPAFVRGLHDEIRTELEQPRSIRGHLGFNLKFAGSLEPADGGLSNLGSRHAIWIDRDGVLTYAVSAGPDFLGWGLNERRGSERPIIINSLALVETTLEFFRAVYMVLAPRIGLGTWSFRVVAKGWKTAGLALAPGEPEAARWGERSQPASTDDLDDTLEGTASAGKDAYLALERVYGVFGLAPSAIPFVTAGEISEDAIRRRG